jgi:hypothetical protein
MSDVQAGGQFDAMVDVWIDSPLSRFGAPLNQVCEAVDDWPMLDRVPGDRSSSNLRPQVFAVALGWSW